MTKLEKAIKGLEQHANMECQSGREQLRSIICPYFQENECIIKLCRDAIELLKAKYKPPRESRKMLPCKCGCKIREHWFSGSSDNAEGLMCRKCGFTVWGKDGMDVIRKWNEAVKQNDEA